MSSTSSCLSILFGSVVSTMHSTAVRTHSFAGSMCLNPARSWITDGGVKPVWNEVNRFPITGKEGNMRIEVWDHNAMSAHALIGGAIVPLQAVLANGSDSSRIIICDQTGKSAGEVEMVLVFTKVVAPPCLRRIDLVYHFILSCSTTKDVSSVQMMQTCYSSDI